MWTCLPSIAVDQSHPSMSIILNQKKEETKRVHLCKAVVRFIRSPLTVTPRESQSEEIILQMSKQ